MHDAVITISESGETKAEPFSCETYSTLHINATAFCGDREVAARHCGGNIPVVDTAKILAPLSIPLSLPIYLVFPDEDVPGIIE